LTKNVTWRASSSNTNSKIPVNSGTNNWICRANPKMPKPKKESMHSS